MTKTPPTANATSHIPALDGLRGIACLLVLTGHFLLQNRPFVSHGLVTAFSQYWAGVDLFFVISGFVIFLSLDRLQERLGSATAAFRPYFRSRAFRILPLYILLLIGFTYIPWNNRLINSDLFHSSIPQYVYLYFGQSWYMVSHHLSGAGFVSVSWSLCAEVVLYILAFLVIAAVPKQLRIGSMLVLAASSWGLRLHVALAGSNLLAAYLLPTCRMDGFMLGGVVALLHRQGALVKLNRQALDGFLLLGAGIFALLSWHASHFASRFSIEFSYAFYALFFAAALVRLTLLSSPAWLSGGPLKQVGTISYFVYLFHFPIIYALSYNGVDTFVGLNIWVNFLLVLGITFGLGALSWRFLEKPLIARGKASGSAAPASLPATAST